MRVHQFHNEALTPDVEYHWLFSSDYKLTHSVIHGVPPMHRVLTKLQIYLEQSQKGSLYFKKKNLIKVVALFELKAGL